jgi:thiol:disulfide interchange protein DsbD
MEWVKRLMGFVLFGVALYFFSPLLPDGWFLPAFALLALAAGIWLALLEGSGRGTHAMWFLRGATFTVALLAAVFLLRLGGTAGIDWQPYSSAAIESAAARGEPVIIEFTADWCVPCKVMEYGAFKDPEVVQQSRRFVRLRVDLTHQEEPTAVEAIERYQVAGPPTLVFLGPDGKEVRRLRVLETVDADELLTRMRGVPRPAAAAP